MKRRSSCLAFFLLFGTAIAFGASAAELKAIHAGNLLTMLDEETRVDNFRHMERIFPVETIRRKGRPFLFKEAPRDLSGLEYQWDGHEYSLQHFLDKTITTNFLVIKDDTIVYERYFRGNTKDSLATSMSVAKSFTSALIGIAYAEGRIKSLNEPITNYLPKLKNSGYNGVPIKHLLQMSSGIDFSEVYDDETSDIILMMGALGAGGSIEDYAASLQSQRKSGEAFNYASIDTNVLGLLLEKTTGKNPAKYLEKKIWRKLGMESDATWGTDNHGNVITFAWLNVTARDYAKFGRLYLHKGNWNGEQILPASWVERSVKPDKDYLKLKDSRSGWDIGYQYQWWVPEGGEGEFTGIGVWGQYLYVNPACNLIIVKNSVDPDFGKRDLESIALFRAIARHLEN